LQEAQVEKPHNPLRPALAEALGLGPDPPSEPRQLDLTMPLPTDVPSPEESQPSDLLGLPHTAAAREKTAIRSNAGKGRPRGVHNHKTERWIGYLLKRYPSPLEGAVQLANAPIAELAQELRCSPLDAAKLKVQAMAASIPYLHQRLASVELKPPGSPDGVPVSLPYSDEIIDVTPESGDGEGAAGGEVAPAQGMVKLEFIEDNDG
jgi:hypothetical protein